MVRSVLFIVFLFCISLTKSFVDDVVSGKEDVQKTQLR